MFFDKKLSNLPPRLEIIMADRTGVQPFLSKSLVKWQSLATRIQNGTIMKKYMASKTNGHIMAGHRICGIMIEL